MNTVNKYINYLHEIMQDHYENNKSIYNDETPEWKSVDRMNHKIMWIVRDYFEERKDMYVQSNIKKKIQREEDRSKRSSKSDV